MTTGRTDTNHEDRSRWIDHIDNAVSEVFERMLSRPCALTAPPASTSGNISATIHFSGALEGECILKVSPATADRLTDALLGSEGDWDDQMIDDAVGELCNMIAGGWKSRLGALAAVSHLSVPSVRRGLARTQPGAGDTTQRFYTFDGSILEVALALA